MLVCSLIKIYGAKHVSVVRHRDGVHPEDFHLMDQVLDAVRPVQKGVLRVEMEVSEVGRHPGPRF